MRTTTHDERDVLAGSVIEDPICGICGEPMEPIPPVGWICSICLRGHEEAAASSAFERRAWAGVS
jgi:hypothetical protein